MPGAAARSWRHGGSRGRGRWPRRRARRRTTPGVAGGRRNRAVARVDTTQRRPDRERMTRVWRRRRQRDRSAGHKGRIGEVAFVRPYQARRPAAARGDCDQIKRSDHADACSNQAGRGPQEGGRRRPSTCTTASWASGPPGRRPVSALALAWALASGRSCMTSPRPSCSRWCGRRLHRRVGDRSPPGRKSHRFDRCRRRRRRRPSCPGRPAARER